MIDFDNGTNARLDNVPVGVELFWGDVKGTATFVGIMQRRFVQSLIPDDRSDTTAQCADRERAVARSGARHVRGRLSSRAGRLRGSTQLVSVVEDILSVLRVVAPQLIANNNNNNNNNNK